MPLALSLPSLPSQPPPAPAATARVGPLVRGPQQPSCMPLPLVRRTVQSSLRSCVHRADNCTAHAATPPLLRHHS